MRSQSGGINFCHLFYIFMPGSNICVTLITLGCIFQSAFLDKNVVLLPSHWFRLKWIKRDAKCFPHEKIN